MVVDRLLFVCLAMVWLTMAVVDILILLPISILWDGGDGYNYTENNAVHMSWTVSQAKSSAIRAGSTKTELKLNRSLFSLPRGRTFFIKISSLAYVREPMSCIRIMTFSSRSKSA